MKKQRNVKIDFLNINRTMLLLYKEMKTSLIKFDRNKYLEQNQDQIQMRVIIKSVKIKEINDNMIDLYLILTPVSGLLVLLTIINLKFALKQPKSQDLPKYERKKVQNTNPEIQFIVKESAKEQTLQPGFRKTLSYLLKNFTLAEFCLVRRTRNKIPLLLSTSIIALLSIIINLPYVFCFMGTAVTLIFVFGKMLTEQEEENKDDIESAIISEKVKKPQKFEQKLQIILTSLSLIINLVFIAIAFKNYRNHLLLSVIQNFLITMAIDNFILKPLILTFTAFLIKNVEFVDNYIDKQLQVIQILHGERVVKKISTDAYISALSPRKLRSSPSKVPRAVQIEPRINLDSTDNFISSTFDLTKNLHRPKLSPINLKKIEEKHVEEDCSLISILHSHQKKKTLDQNISHDFNKSLFEQKVQDEQPQPQPVPDAQFDNNPLQKDNNDQEENEQIRKNQIQSLKLIMISNDHSIINDISNTDIQNQEEEDNKSIINQQLQNDDYKTISRNCQGMKIFLQKSIDQQNDDNDNFDDLFRDHNPYDPRPHTTLEEDNSILGYATITNTSRGNGLLKINEDRRAEDLEEIDLNSPERRKQPMSKVVDGQIPKKKKKTYKKYSLDPNRHVIKHSTGEPYLEFLPNLLNKEREQKKKNSNQGSQNTFSRKVDLMNGFVNESRLTKSVKKPKNTREPILKANDENRIPQFVIEDFN